MLLREASLDDAARIAEIYRPYVEDSAVSFEEHAPDAEEMRRRIERGAAYCPWWVATRDDLVIGYVYGCAHRDRWAYRVSCEVSAYVDLTAQRGGVARALYLRLFDELRARDKHNAYAGIANPDENSASVGFHTSMGFRFIGLYEKVGFKFDRWHDVAWYGLRLR